MHVLCLPHPTQFKSLRRTFPKGEGTKIELTHEKIKVTRINELSWSFSSTSMNISITYRLLLWRCLFFILSLPYFLIQFHKLQLDFSLTTKTCPLKKYTLDNFSFYFHLFVRPTYKVAMNYPLKRHSLSGNKAGFKKFPKKILKMKIVKLITEKSLMIENLLLKKVLRICAR